MTQDRESPPRVDAAASPIMAALRKQVDDLRALTLGLGLAILLVWIVGVFAGLSLLGRFCCGQRLVSILEFGGPGILTALVTTALLVSSIAIWTARSRETRALGEEWSALSIDSASLLSVHLLERAGAWRDALRRNFEASVVSGILLPAMVFLLVFSIAVALPHTSPDLPWVITVGLTLGCATFACLQVGAILISVRRTRSKIDQQRLAALIALKEQGGTGVGPPSVAAEVARPTDHRDGDLVDVERALLLGEERARQTAGTERLVAIGVIIAASLALLSMAAASGWSLSHPAEPYSYQFGAVSGDGGAGIVLAIVGFVGVLWASSILRSARGAGKRVVAETFPGSPTAPALSSIDEAVEQLDRARATAARGRNAVVLSAVLVVTRIWFVPVYFGVPADVWGLAYELLSNLALPLALLVVVWTAYRLDGMENLQTELRRWVLALARLEQAFWERY